MSGSNEPLPNADADAEPGPASEPPGYAAAMEELETIVERLEHDDLDVDRLASDVARAAELVAICRGRIEAARLQVQQVVDDLG
ncbi:MAG TPA: exodeoxyribonuclease VII small subunit [Acidimicrobiales bacterium]